MAVTPFTIKRPRRVVADGSDEEENDEPIALTQTTLTRRKLRLIF